MTQDDEERWRAMGRHYDRTSYDYESGRLDRNIIERELTLVALERHLPEAGMVADVGVGVGHYAAFLARRGHEVHLVDVSEALLDAARARLEDTGLATAIAGRHHASAESLPGIAPGSLDALLMLGPLYHLPHLEERRAAIAEARRVLRPGGVLFAAGINRLAYLRDLYLFGPEEVVGRDTFHDRWLEDGAWDENVPYPSPLLRSHGTSVAGLRELAADGFEEVAMYGLEGFVPETRQGDLADMSEPARRAWLDLLVRTAAWPEVVATSNHILLVCQKTAP